jgi:cytosine/adenosine deaminase-related metal-dependent hydrolase
MILRNLNIVGSDGLKDILIENEKIIGLSPTAAGPTGIPAIPTIRNLSTGNPPAGPSLSFPDALAFPGLINSHDHLDFNLFPPLANRIYDNYTEWGADIQKHNRQEIDPVLKIPQTLRTQWGVYKNLLNGVTTVVNHGEKLGIEEEPITVFQDCHCLHSVGFEKNWKWKLNRPFAGPAPFVLHVGEGTVETSTREIDRLIRWNLFKRPLIGVHGVAMREDQAGAFRGLVWCPATNYFLLGRTAPVDRLRKRVPILFGTDSTLTAGWNIWEQIRLARKEGAMTDPELLDTLTRTPATVWRLADRGELAPGRMADLVIARPKKGLGGMDAFFAIDPEDILLVLHCGRIRLFDSSLLNTLASTGFAVKDYHPVVINEEHKYVQGDLQALAKKIKGYYPGASFPFPID